MKRRLLHSHDVVTSVNAVQYGKDADMENQGVTLWKRFLNRRKSINTVSQNNCTLAISIEMSEGQYERSSTCLYQKSQHIFPDSSQQKVLREKHKKQGKYRVTLPASDTRQFWDSLCWSCILSIVFMNHWVRKQQWEQWITVQHQWQLCLEISNSATSKRLTWTTETEEPGNYGSAEATPMAGGNISQLLQVVNSLGAENPYQAER